MKVAVTIKMPKWDQTMKEGKITRWFKQEGDSVEKDEDLFEVQTGKNTDKVKSPAAGRLSQIMISAGKKAPVKVVVAILSEPGERQNINSKSFKP
jgi:pyruvate dehydrogenase E2 component (dihydrolipoamide acetyltransferase)